VSRRAGARPRRAAALALALAALAGAGCGGEDDPAAGTTTAESAESGDDRIVVRGADGAFSAAAVYERAAPGVVTVSSIFDGGASPLGGPQAGQGSGFVLNDDGEIVTNAHVVTDGQAGGGANIREASEVYVQFSDRNQVPAKIVGFDPYADVALLEVDPGGIDLQPLELGSLEDVGVGEPVAAIGSPFGERQSLSVGVISALDRAIPSLTEFDILGAIQTDASINPGNSGGPLLDAEGRVVGINQQIDTTSGGNQGVGFAVPIDLAQRSIEQLREKGEVEYAYLGVTTVAMYPQLAERLDLEVDTGALVDEIVPGSPADEAGLRAGSQRIEFQGARYTVGGDVITAIDGEELVDGEDLPVLVSRYDPGDTVTLEVIRDGETEELDITFGTRPDSLEVGE
jgi:S1-C subfamily serine protease